MGKSIFQNVLVVTEVKGFIFKFHVVNHTLAHDILQYQIQAMQTVVVYVVFRAFQNNC